KNVSCVKVVYPSDGNFLLVKVDDAKGLYTYLTGLGIIVRNRSSLYGCENCLRITVGSEEEDNILLEGLKKWSEK
ncbi:MAG: histidinol-phosphate transaminase, partial [Sphaerochaetaceae bacterium]|nr:histidinol-phosphate transaminase [Sphaerochaetaceae bacterium]